MTFTDIEIERIIRNVCDGTAVPERDIMGHHKRTDIVFARFILYNRLLRYGLTGEQIGRVTDGRTISTIRHGLKQYKALMKTNAVFRDMVRGVEMVEALPF